MSRCTEINYTPRNLYVALHEKAVVHPICIAAEWGFPFVSIDIKDLD